MKLMKKFVLMSGLLSIAGIVGCSTEAGGEPEIPGGAAATGGMPEGVREQGLQMQEAMRKGMDMQNMKVPESEEE